MHVDAFFDFLLQRPSTYWTDLPSDSDPVADSERDGVAAEDDMALRALMPQLNPCTARGAAPRTTCKIDNGDPQVPWCARRPL